MENITSVLYEDFKNNKTKIGQKIFNIFNHDLCSVIVNNGVLWVEKTSQYNIIPNYFINYLVKYLYKKYNYKYLYSKIYARTKKEV